VNDDLYKGTMFLYIEEALSQGFGVACLNPNLTRDPKSNYLVPCNKSPAEHTIRAFDDVLRRSAASKTVLVGHSTGGDCLLYLLSARPEVQLKSKAIVFLDSSHSVSDCPVQLSALIQSVGKCWNSDPSPLGSNLQAPSQKCGCPCVSSGDKKRDLTPYLVKDQVWIHINHHLPWTEPKTDDFAKAKKDWTERHTF